MHYYKRHLGDYARDTGHLTALEHGVYTLLLDWYYVNEQPIPPEKAKRIARGNPEETQTVLAEFFTLCDEGWRHTRADREISEYHAKAERNREAGLRGGRPPKQKPLHAENPEKTQTVSKRNPEITLTTNHKPLTNNQEKKQKTAPTGVDLFPGVGPQVVSDFRKLRDKLRAPVTQTAVDGIKREAAKAGMTLEAALTMCCERGWRGFKAEWVSRDAGPASMPRLTA